MDKKVISAKKEANQSFTQTLAISQQLMQRATLYAKETGITVTNQIRYALDEFLKKNNY